MMNKIKHRAVKEKHYFSISLLVMIIGILLIIAAICLDIKYPEHRYFAAIMPIATYFISGAAMACIAK